MEVKKKNFLENLRLKTKFGNMKKPGRKALAKRGRNLAHRRSISVPDLRLVPGEAFSADNALDSGASDSTFFGDSTDGNDTDSMAGVSVSDQPLCTDGLNDSAPETSLRVSRDHTRALNRISAPVGTLALYEDIDHMMIENSESKVNLTQEAVYAQVTKRNKPPIPTLDSIPAPRQVSSTTPRPDLVETGSLSGEKESTKEEAKSDRVHSGALAAALVRAQSLGEQVNPYTEKRNTPSEKGTPPTVRQTADRTSLMLDTLGVGDGDGTSLDSACGTPSEEPVSMPWTTDSEEPEQEPCSPFVTGQRTGQAVLEEAPDEETQELTEEVSGTLYALCWSF